MPLPSNRFSASVDLSYVGLLARLLTFRFPSRNESSLSGERNTLSVLNLLVVMGHVTRRAIMQRSISASVGIGLLVKSCHFSREPLPSFTQQNRPHRYNRVLCKSGSSASRPSHRRVKSQEGILVATGVTTTPENSRSLYQRQNHFGQRRPGDVRASMWYWLWQGSHQTVTLNAVLTKEIALTSFPLCRRFSTQGRAKPMR